MEKDIPAEDHLACYDPGLLLSVLPNIWTPHYLFNGKNEVSVRTCYKENEDHSARRINATLPHPPGSRSALSAEGPAGGRHSYGLERESSVPSKGSAVR